MTVEHSPSWIDPEYVPTRNQVDKVLGIVQKHLVDKNPAEIRTVLEDPETKQSWTLDTHIRDKNGKVGIFSMYTGGLNKGPMEFYVLGVGASHIDGRESDPDEYENTSKFIAMNLRAAQEAEVQLRKLLKLPLE